MGIWIRSQDKKVLVKVQKLDIYDNQICNKGKVLGRYLTPMRTLEVLDEIQKLLMPQVKVIHNKTEEVKLQDFTSNIIVQPVIEDTQTQQASSYVYEMPKE